MGKHIAVLVIQPIPRHMDVADVGSCCLGAGMGCAEAV